MGEIFNVDVNRCSAASTDTVPRLYVNASVSALGCIEYIILSDCDGTSANRLAEPPEGIVLGIGLRLKRDGFLSLQTNKSKKAGILLQDKKSLGEEAYELSVAANKVVIKASTPAGFFYALRTVNQLILADENHTSLPCILFPRDELCLIHHQ